MRRLSSLIIIPILADGRVALLAASYLTLSSGQTTVPIAL